MQISSRFTIAVHTLLCIEHFCKDYKVTSNFIASSVNVNPVIIRKILGKLKEAGFVNVEAGVGGAFLAKEPSEITLLDIFDAVECADENFFGFHQNPNPKCPVGANIHNVLDKELYEIQAVFENRLRQTTLKNIIDDMENLISK